jgi:progressive ankylosis protein
MPGTKLRHKPILYFWLPLAASWALMGAETPILQAAIARLPNMEVQLAAFGIVSSLEIAIESPVIMLLATATALANSRRNYLTLRRFMIWVNVLVTLVAIAMTWEPFFHLVVKRMMGIPAEIAFAAQPAMRIMIFWSAAIGIRRFYQGILIRRGQTRWVGYGTAVRLFSSGGTGILLAVFSNLPGVVIGGTGLMAGVASEAVFVFYAARPTVRSILAEPDRTTGSLAFMDVVRYHTPLAATSLLSLMAQPVIGAGLARMPQPEQNLAAWPIVWNITWIFRSPSYALPEAVIALVSANRPLNDIRTFCTKVGLWSSGFLMLFTFTPLLTLYLKRVAGLTDSLSGYVVPGLLLMFFLPAVNSMHSWYRGLLMEARLTRFIYWGMGLNLVLTGLVVIGAVLFQGRGAVAGGIAITASFLAEIVYLRSKTRTLQLAD